MTKIKIGSRVRVKEGVSLKNGFEAHNWAGKVLNYFPEFDSYAIQLDSTTINELSDEFLEDLIQRMESPLVRTFKASDLEKSKRRDLKKTYERSCENLIQRLEDLQEKQVRDFNDQSEAWMEDFLKTTATRQYSTEQKQTAEEQLPYFIELMIEYEHYPVSNWRPYQIAEFCINIYANHLSCEEAEAPFVGPILHDYFDYLAREQGLTEARAIAQILAIIEPELTEHIISPERELWDLAQSIVEGADEDFFDWELGDDPMDDLNFILGGIPEEP
ncbi:MAG: hypothetical protein AAFW73_24820 [Bacteroidota bacterium]